MTALRQPMPDWTRWGATVPTLPLAGHQLLVDRLGPLEPATPVGLADVVVPPSRLPADALADLAAALGPDRVRDDDDSRAARSGGQSYLDLVRRRTGDTRDAPDAVVAPADRDGVASVLAICERHRVGVVPYGGGTSVVGGLDAVRDGVTATVTLDLSSLAGLLALDETSQLATFGAGTTTPAAEAAIRAQGLTLGHSPQSYARATLGGYAVTRSAGQASLGYGRFDDLLVGLAMTTPRGELVLPAVPGSAAGPDLRRLVMGSEGTLGVVTEVTVRVRPVPQSRRYEGWMLPDWDSGLALLRTIAQAPGRPDIARLSDVTETEVSLALASTPATTRRVLDRYLRLRGAHGGCLLVLGFEGERRDVGHRRHDVAHLVRAADGVALGARAGRSWEHHRFDGPSTRDTLLDAGLLVETLETATTWAGLSGLYDAIRASLTASLSTAGRPPLLGVHVSHLYPTGASLYVTVLAAADPTDRIGQWETAKTACNQAIVAAGGTITHHHGVGTAHRDAVGPDLGGHDGVGVAALRAVKAACDPAGILNPGKLLPPG